VDRQGTVVEQVPAGLSTASVLLGPPQCREKIVREDGTGLLDRIRRLEAFRRPRCERRAERIGSTEQTLEVLQRLTGHGGGTFVVQKSGRLVGREHLPQPIGILPGHGRGTRSGPSRADLVP